MAHLERMRKAPRIVCSLLTVALSAALGCGSNNAGGGTGGGSGGGANPGGTAGPGTAGSGGTSGSGGSGPGGASGSGGSSAGTGPGGGSGQAGTSVGGTAGASLPPPRPVTFRAAPDYSITGDFQSSNSFAAADFDGDGKPDLAVGQEAPDAVNVFLNLGDGTFGAARSIPLADPATVIAAGDLDGDGKPDLAVVSARANAPGLAVLIGKGGGSFGAPTVYAAGAAASIAIVDLDADGHPDVVTAGEDVSVRFNRGDGSLADPISSSLAVTIPPECASTAPKVLPGLAASLVVGDFNRDGRPDLAVGNTVPNTCVTHTFASLFLNRGDGTFGSPTHVPTTATPVAMATGDLNRDGWTDLAFITVALADTVTVLINDRSGSGFLPADHPAMGAQYPYAIEIADFDGDARLDLAVADADATILVASNQGNQPAAGGAPAGVMFGEPSPLLVASTPAGLMASDLDADGKVDLATLAGDGLVVLRNAGAGGFTAASSLDVPSQITAAVVGDVDKDGSLDFVMVHPNCDGNECPHSVATVVLGRFDGSFGPPVDFAADGSGADAVALGDIDGDGALDLAIAAADTNTVSVLHNQGQGFFMQAVAYTAGKNPSAIVLADFDGDHRPDMAVANHDDATVSVWLNDGHGGFGAAVDLATGAGPAAIAVGDVDGDGNPDMACADADAHDVQLFRNDGKGGFTPLATISAPANYGPAAVAIGDLDGDRYGDVVVGDFDGAVVVHRSLGGGVFAPSESHPAAHPVALFLADLNGDGALDLVAAGQQGVVNVFLGYGNGALAPAGAYGAGRVLASVVAGDFNRDGKIDVAVADVFLSKIQLLLNSSP